MSRTRPGGSLQRTQFFELQSRNIPSEHSHKIGAKIWDENVLASWVKNDFVLVRGILPRRVRSGLRQGERNVLVQRELPCSLQQPRRDRGPGVMRKSDAALASRFPVDDTMHRSRDCSLIFDVIECAVRVDRERAEGAIDGLEALVQAEKQAAVRIQG